MGRNASECRAGLESEVADAEPPTNGRRPMRERLPNRMAAPGRRGNGNGTCGRFPRQRGRPGLILQGQALQNVANRRRVGRESPEAHSSVEAA